MIAESVHDLVIHDFRPAVTDVLVHVDPDGSPQSHRLETHSEANTVAEQVETLQMLNPEDLEAQVRAALLQDPGDPDLPQIIEVTELHTYYYMEPPMPCSWAWQQTNYSSGAAIAVTQNKGRKRGEDVVVTPGSNEVFTITILMDGHGGQSVMKRAVDLQKELLEMCRSLADWPRCAVEATEHVQDHVRMMRYRSGATFLALVVEEASSKAAFAWAGDSMGILVPELRYACACGTCIATPEGYVEARDDALVFRSLAFECHSQTVVCPDCGQAIGFKNESLHFLRRDRIQSRTDKLQVLVCSLKQQEITEVSQVIAGIFPCDVRSRLLLKAELRQFTALPGKPELVVVVHRNEGRALLTDRNGFYHEVLGTAWKQTRGNVLVVLTRVEPQEPTDLYDKNMLRSLSTQGDQPTMGALGHAGRVLTWGNSPSAEQLQQILKLMTKAYFHESIHATGIPQNWNKPSPKASGWTVAFRTSTHTAESEAEISRIRHHRPPYQYRLDDGYLCALKRPSCVMPTRGLGDVDLESAGFLAVPETSDFMTMGEEDFVLIASDGIWDVLGEEDVLAHVQVGSWQTNLATSEMLAKRAIQEWLRQYGRASEADDVSVAIVQPRLSASTDGKRRMTSRAFGVKRLMGPGSSEAEADAAALEAAKAFRAKLIKKGVLSEPDPRFINEVPGVKWNKNQQKWVVDTRRRPKRIFGGSFTEKAKAETKALQLINGITSEPPREVRGVRWSKHHQKWEVRFQTVKKRIYGGQFADKAAAEAKAFELQEHGSRTAAAKGTQLAGGHALEDVQFPEAAAPAGALHGPFPGWQKPCRSAATAMESPAAPAAKRRRLTHEGAVEDQHLEQKPTPRQNSVAEQIGVPFRAEGQKHPSETR
eukprot:s832_g9.t3